MNASQSLIASAEIAERAGRTKLAEFWHGLAKQALDMEAAGFPGFYDHWARDIATRASGMIDFSKCREDAQCRCTSCRPSLIDQQRSAA